MTQTSIWGGRVTQTLYTYFYIEIVLCAIFYHLKNIQQSSHTLVSRKFVMISDNWLEDFLDETTTGSDEENENESGNLNDTRWQVSVPTYENTFFTMNQAHKDAWKIARDEIGKVQESITCMCEKSDAKDVKDEDLVGLIFGKSGVFTELLTTDLKLSLNELYAFMARFCLLSTMRNENTNVSKILKSLDVNVIGMMSENKFNETYKTMSDSSLLEESRPTKRRPKCLWEKIQVLLNDLLHEILITDRSGCIGAVIDDDKVWCFNSGKNAIDRRNVKYSVHVRDNRRGFNIHAFASFFTFFPMHAIVEREGDSATSALRQGLRSLFGCSEQTSSQSDNNFFIGGDRGYFGGSPSIRTVCKEGGDICGTTKRGRDTPFTTGSLHDQNDDRILLNPIGSPCLYVAETKIEGKKVTATAFRTGTGQIANAISSKHHRHWWDAQTVDGRIERPKETEMFKRMSITEQVDTIGERTALTELMSSSVTVVTTEQGRACWHLFRKFSMTSHQSIESIRTMFPYFWKESMHKDDWISVAAKLYGPEWQHSNNNLVPIEDREGAIIFDPTVELETFIFHISSWEDDDIAIVELKRMILDNETLNCNDAKNKINEMPKATRKKISEFLVQRVPLQCRVQTILKKYLELFYSKTNCYRKWIFYKKESLIATGTVFGIKRSLLNSNLGVWSQLAVSDSRPRTQNHSSDLPTMRSKGIRSILDKAFHSPFTGSRKSDCEMGHKNEPAIIKNFVHQVNAGKDANGNQILFSDLNEILAVYTTGLVEKKDKPFVKDSIDFIAIVLTDDGNIECWGGEVKTRTKASTKEKEINYQISRFRNSPIPPIFSEIDFKLVHKHVKNVGERCQLMHHAFAYDFDKIFFVLGDCHCNVIHADLVKFSSSDRSEYGNMVTEVFNETLLWAYPEQLFDTTVTGEPEEVDIPNDVIDAAKTIEEIGDANALKSTFFLWLTAYCDVKKNGPFPPIHRIIPMQHSWWNVVKPGGDNITQLVENQVVKHPHVDFETRPSTRLLQYAFVTVHRLRQALSANIERYSSVTQYRHCASKRTTFIDTMLACFQIFLRLSNINNDELYNDVSNENQGQQIRTPQRMQTRFRTQQGRRFIVEDSLYTKPPTCLTPTKTCRERLDFDGQDEFCKRRKECMGPPVLLKSNGGGGRRCCYCKKKTFWMCQGCHLVICHGSSSPLDKAIDENKKIFSVADPSPRKGSASNFFFVETCFLATHPALRIDNS